MELKTKRLVSTLVVALSCVSMITFTMVSTAKDNSKENVCDINYDIPVAGISGVIYSNSAEELSAIANDNTIVGSTEEETAEAEVEEEVVEVQAPVITDVEDYNMYIGSSIVNVRSGPSTDYDVVAKFTPGTIITVIAETDNNWVIINYNDQEAYVCKDYVQEMLPEEATYNWSWAGEKLNRNNGKVSGPSGNETYYNLNMSRCVYYMNCLGYYYPVWTRSDGTKMFGNAIMVAADLNVHPKGSLVETSLGTGIVVDTGSFVTNGSGVDIDIAVTW